MHPNLRKASVNWIDGMKVNKNHFQQTEDWVIDHLKDTAAIGMTDHDYGLLPNSQDVDNAVNYQIEIEQTHFVKITLLSCRAITRGGIRIEITPYISKLYSLDKSLLEVHFDLKSASNQQYDIVVTVDPFNRIPVGDPNPDEHPLRHPYSIPKYSVDVIPSNQVNTQEFSTYHLSIGKFRVIAGEVQVEDYIPPCTSIHSHSTLTEFYRGFEKLLIDIKQHLTQYVKKSRSMNGHMASQNVVLLAENILYHIALFEDEYQIELPSHSPVHMFKYFKRMMRLISSDLSCMPEEIRLQVYGIFNQSFTAGTFENTLTTILNLKYSHRDIYLVINKLLEEVSRFGEIISRLPFTAPTAAPVPEYKQPEEPQKSVQQEVKVNGPKIFRGGQQISR